MKVAIVSLSLMFGLIVSAVVVAKPWVTIRHTKPIVVKGYAELPVTADAASLSAQVLVTSTNRSDAYQEAGAQLDRVKDMIRKKLGDDMELVELSTITSEISKLNENGKRMNVVEYYNVTRRVRVNSASVRDLKDLGRALYDLNGEGIRISVSGPEFYVSELESIKLELVEAATKNGKERAALMAESSGERLGSLVSARQGVIQITKQNSSATSSYGIYDTETIDKVVKLVVTLEFEISE